MADTCPDHGLPTTSVCGSCVRPLCRRCPVEGTVPRCQECQMAKVKAGSFSPGSGLSLGRLIFLLLLGAAIYFATQKACTATFPRGVEWLH